MKVLLELLGDTSRVLESVEDLGDFRPDSRERVRELLVQLRTEADRILSSEPAVDSPKREREEYFQRALEAISSGAYEIARGVLEDSVARFPEDFEFWSYLGLIAWEQGDLEGAEAAYHRAEEIAFGDGLDPVEVESAGDPALRAVEGRALSLYKMGELERAVQRFEWLGKNFPDQYVGCTYLAGEIHHLRGFIDEALRCYEQVPAEPAVLYNRGLAHFELGQLQEGAESLIQAFVSNVHVAASLLGRYAYQRPCTPGYLGSESYAEEFATACRKLWHQAPGSLHFMEVCFDHHLVQRHLEACSEQGGAMLLQVGDGQMEGEGWLEELQGEGTVSQMAGRVVMRLRS